MFESLSAHPVMWEREAGPGERTQSVTERQAQAQDQAQPRGPAEAATDAPGRGGPASARAGRGRERQEGHQDGRHGGEGNRGSTGTPTHQKDAGGTTGRARSPGRGL